MSSDRLIHYGIVEACGPASVKVRLTDTGGDKCGGCSAKFLCKPGDDPDAPVLDVASPDSAAWKPGERVRLTLADSRRWGAMTVGLLLPCVALMAGVGAGYLLDLDEGLCALLGLGTTALYFGGLYLMRRRVDAGFSWHIEKI